MPRIVRLIEARDGKHKWIAEFSDGKRTAFGATGYEDYTQHKDKERRELYRLRHKKDLDTGDSTRAGYLSYYILWGDSTTIAQNVRSYNKRFGTKE